ncbi:DUF454 family protein [Loigolactobacillus coryniformis]|uniref:DUF454 domain-containing protein n=1 Tax=Loigolactobacillus coryniformis TaxID=1610 RepID=A0A5B8TEK4_9LACO|nr:DUF454 family protein [Loigolactobacillus coryniformis]QEA52907.1 DUF454 domain-containing protein [Loigolactobacillus coryniformis]
MTFLLLKVFWSFSALTSLLLGVAGLIFPIIPGIPFLILALISIEKLSPRFKRWLLQTRPMLWLQNKQPKLAGCLIK